MPGLNKQQKEFRKQIQELQRVETYKNIMEDHDSFYHNTAYEQKKLLKAAKTKRNNRILIFIIFLFLIGGFIYKNIDIVKSTYSALKSKYESTNNINKTSNFNFNKLKLSKNEIKQNQIGEYHKDYTKKIENLNISLENIINKENITYSDISRIYEQQKIINELIIKFESYIPEDINITLHQLNIEQLYNYKNLYNAAELLITGYQNDNTLIEFNNSYNNIAILGLKFREKLLIIFHEINMKYNILENDTIHFTYPLI